jgi:hypothetical protein
VEERRPWISGDGAGEEGVCSAVAAMTFTLSRLYPFAPLQSA